MTETHPIVRSGNDAQGAYEIMLEGSDHPAELTWVADGTTRVADHTFVPPEARGLGLAAKLVEALVEDAREQGFTIKPTCSYVATMFRRHPEWADLQADA